MDFVEFPKMARLKRQCVVTEKIDGTNACIHIGENGEFLTGSRTRWITPADDNYGFSKWAHEHQEELEQLGPGTHFGEWWGSGCQRGYGLPKGEKRFSLFNTIRWCDHNAPPAMIETGDPRIVKWQQNVPACCHVVPVLYIGPFSERAIDVSIEDLRLDGSAAAPGFMRPEGVIVWHTAANIGLKVTLEKDEQPKGKAKELVTQGGNISQGHS